MESLKATAVVESPFTAESFELECRNRLYAQIAMGVLFREGYIPFASHAIYTLLGVLDDSKREERKMGIEAGLYLASVMDHTFVFTDLGVSPGMDMGIADAKKEGRPITTRKIFGEDDDLSTYAAFIKASVLRGYLPEGGHFEYWKLVLKEKSVCADGRSSVMLYTHDDLVNAQELKNDLSREQRNCREVLYVLALIIIALVIAHSHWAFLAVAILVSCAFALRVFLWGRRLKKTMAVIEEIKQELGQ